MRPEDDPDVLHDLYVTQHLNLNEVAAVLGVSNQLVSRRLDHFGIPKRQGRDYPKGKPRTIVGFRVRDPKLAERLGLRS